SVSPWSLLVRPPREMPMACAKAPFCATGRAVRLDVCGIDGHRAPHRAVTGQGLEHAQPDALPAPAVEAVVNGGVSPYSGGQSRQRAPLLSICTMPEITRRSSTRWAPLRPRGSNGSIRDHSASLSHVKFHFINTSDHLGQDDRAFAATRQRTLIVRDTELKGFFIMVGARKRIFMVQADLRTEGKRGSTIRVAIGDTTEFSTRAARAVAKEYLIQIGRGIHPKNN